MTAIVVDNAPGGNYLKKLNALVSAHPELNGNCADIDVRHDDWCAIHQTFPCNCDPDVEIRKVAVA